MLLGRLPNVLSLDQKGRLVIPSRIRDAWCGDGEQESETVEFHLGCLLDRCLYLHTKEQHQAFLDDFDSAVDDTAANRRLKTLVHSSFVPVTMDKAGRVSIPAYLIEKAGISKEVVLIGMRERLELWGREHHEELERQCQDEFRTSLESALQRAGKRRRNDDGEGDGE